MAWACLMAVRQGGRFLCGQSGAAGNACKLVLQGLTRQSVVVARLPAQPPAVAETEVAAKPKIRIGRDGPLASGDVTNPLWRDTDVFGKTVLRQAQGLQELFFERPDICLRLP